MDFEVDIHGLGSLESLKLNIKPLTVIAGENSSGKSFATKSLYCVLAALNQNHITNSLSKDASLFVRNLTGFEFALANKIAIADKEFIYSVRDDFIALISSINSFLIELNLSEQETVRTELEVELKELIEISDRINKYLDKRGTLKKVSENKAKLLDALNIIDRIIDSIRDHKKLVVASIKKQLSDNFKKNFQVTSLSTLVNHEDTVKASIKIENIGHLDFDSDDNISFSFVTDGIVEIQKLENIVFIDSPVYLRIRNGLERKNILPVFRKDDRYLKGYPSYIDNLYGFIDKQFLDEPDFIEISKDLQNTLSGKLAVTKSGEINYVTTEGITTPLSLTAMGISNLGLIDLLIRNNIINKGSFLIIDEPEAHIHPKWQVTFMELLYKMAKAGANVIIATHSLDMVKKLELLVKQDPDAEDVVSVQKMPSSKLEVEATLKDKIEEVLEDLSTPFYQMYMEDLE